MKTEVVILDTDMKPGKWYPVTTVEDDGKMTTISERSFAMGIEQAIRISNSIQNDNYRLENEPDCLFAEDLRHEFPVAITVVGDFYNVRFIITEEE